MIIYPDNLNFNLDESSEITDLDYLNKFNIKEIRYNRKNIKTELEISIFGIKNKFKYVMDSRLFDVFLSKKTPNNRCPICDKLSYIHEYRGSKLLNIVCCS